MGAIPSLYSIGLGVLGRDPAAVCESVARGELFATPPAERGDEVEDPLLRSVCFVGAVPTGMLAPSGLLAGVAAAPALLAR